MLERQQQITTCKPSEFEKYGFSSLCAYVRNNSEHCEGGGYILWTELLACSSSSSLKTTITSTINFFEFLIILLAIIFFLFLFLHLSVAADLFFCENIATIVDLNNISQNIAGITFMAFGNGAPDIFGSIVSIISVPKPRADLAISELLGGSIFVTTCVIASISITTKPFLLMRRPILRDLIFHSFALILLLLISNWEEGKMFLWQPLAFLALYSIYATTVITGNLLNQKMLKNKRKKKKNKLQKVISNIFPKKIGPSEICSNEKGSVAIDCKNSVVKEETNRDSEPKDQQKQRSVLQLPVNALSIPKSRSICVIEENDLDEDQEEEFHALKCLEVGKFFGKEELDAEGEEVKEEVENNSRSTSPLPLDLSISTCCYGSISSPSQTIKTNLSNLTPLSPSGSSSATLSPCRSDIAILPNKRNKIKLIFCIIEDDTFNKELIKFWQIICPLNWNKLKNDSIAGRIYRIVKIPSLILLGLTIPRANYWSKPLAILHSFFGPLIICFAFKLCSYQIFYIFNTINLAILISLFFSIFVAVTTSFDKEPFIYKWISSHVGFILSIAWIYATAAEVLNVVLMLGNLFHIPHQILGLTVVAWCNSIGDLIADVSVARQGMPRMALSAAIGGPLFNLMVGFGSSFTIAKLQGKDITIKSNPVSNIMFLFLGISLLTTLIFLFTQKFNIKRIHGLTLFIVYLIFIISVILSELSLLPFPF